MPTETGPRTLQSYYLPVGHLHALGEIASRRGISYDDLFAEILTGHVQTPTPGELQMKSALIPDEIKRLLTERRKDVGVETESEIVRTAIAVYLAKH